MRIHFDITHPAHVHLFKHTIDELDRNDATVHVTSRDKDLTVDLLDAYDIDHTPISAKSERKLSLLTEWAVRELRLLTEVRVFDPDVIVGVLNPPVTHVAKLTGRQSVIFDDSEKSASSGYITHPFADVICTPKNFDRDLGDAQRRYRGFHELAYLHPKWFTPDPGVLQQHDIDPSSRYAVVRFVSWGAHHDVNQQGLSLEAKREIVARLEDVGDVYITSESDLPPEFEEYHLPIPPEHIHQLLAHANVYVGDSQTMATEAAILGTPAVRSNTFAGEDDMSNFVRLEDEYGLLYSTANEEQAIAHVEELLETPDLQERWAKKRQTLIEDSVDVTEFILDTIKEVADA